MVGRLNSFQKSMLQWNDLQPYNAVHVARVRGALEVERLRGAIMKTLEGRGLTGLAVDRRAGTYEYQSGTGSVEVKMVAAERGWPRAVAEEVERQLNEPFVLSERFCPFRFFVVPAPEGFSLGLVYFHVIADAESVVLLLKEIIDTYRGRGNPGPVNAIERYPRQKDNLFLHHPRVLSRKLASVPSLVRNLRHTQRPPYRDPEQLDNKFVMFSLDPQLLSGMAGAAKSLGVTLNDWFLALLMQAVGQLMPERMRTGQRRGFSLGCIVNTRKDLGMNGRGAFGLFLGSFLVHHAVPDGVRVEELARDIARQTLRIKQGRLYLGAALELAFARLMAPLFSAERRKKLYHRHYPLWGGLSNMDVNAYWGRAEESGDVDYLRTVSTGPITPLVVSITTMGEVANVCLSYRSTVFSAADIERIKGCFLKQSSLAASQT